MTIFTNHNDKSLTNILDILGMSNLLHKYIKKIGDTK